MVCPCCCPCRSNSQMPCGYTFPTITASYQYVDYETDPVSLELVLKQGSATATYTPRPSNWYNGNFCGWEDITSGGGLQKVFYFPGPLFGCPGDSSHLMFFRPRPGFTVGRFGGSSLSIGFGLGNPSGRKSSWRDEPGLYSETRLDGFDFEDWYWSCDELIVGSFSRSRKVTVLGEEFGDSVSVTVQ